MPVQRVIADSDDEVLSSEPSSPKMESGKEQQLVQQSFNGSNSEGLSESLCLGTGTTGMLSLTTPTPPRIHHIISFKERQLCSGD
jgi:hypothetical protein